MNGAARDIAALAAAVGVVGLLAPLPMLRSEAQRAGALAVTLAAWALLLASLVPGADARRALDRFTGPTGAVAGVIAVVLLAVALVIAVRVVLGRPLVWFVLLGLALPIRIPVTIGKTDGNLLVPLYAVILIGLAAWIWGRLRGRITSPADEGPPVLTWPLAAFVGFLLVSSLWSADTAEAAKKTVFFYIPFVLLYSLTVAWWPRARALGALAVTTILGATVAAVTGLWQYATSDIWWNQTLHQANVYSRFFRVNGIFFDPNILGRYLVVGLLICVALAWVRRRPAELGLLAAAAVVMAAGLIVTFSRSSALMLMVGLVLLATRAFGPKRALITGVSLLVVAGAIVFATSGNVRHAVTDSHRLERVSEGRFELMKGGLTIWRDQPVAGAGLGGFQTRFEATLTPVEQRRVRVVISHNSPITVLSEDGVIGFALFLALIGGAGWAMVRGSRDQGEVGWARWTLGAIAIGILVHSLLYAAFFEDPFVWVAVGGAVALALSAARPPTVVMEILEAEDT